MTPDTLRLLLAGEYICDYRYPTEFRTLQRVDDQAMVNAWLGKLGMRLARLGSDGAFFMAPLKITGTVASQVKADLRQFRDQYGKAIRMLDLIRQINAERAMCSPGERIQLVHLDAQVSGSTTLAAALRSLIGTIHGSNANFSDRQNLKKLLEHLESDGYMQLLDKASETYQVTGKVDQLYAVLTFLDENKVIEDQAVDDQLDLVDLPPEPGAAASEAP